MATIKGELIAGVICIALGAGLSWYLTDSHWNNKWSARDVADQKAQAAQAQANLVKLHDDAVTLADIDAQNQQKIKDAQDNANAIVTAYQSGALKLRTQFTCATASMSKTSTAANISDAATKCGLQPTDVEFLIQFAEHADELAEQLTSAQNVIRSYYKSINGEDLK